MTSVVAELHGFDICLKETTRLRRSPPDDEQVGDIQRHERGRYRFEGSGLQPSRLIADPILRRVAA